MDRKDPLDRSPCFAVATFGVGGFPGGDTLFHRRESNTAPAISANFLTRDGPRLSHHLE